MAVHIESVYLLIVILNLVNPNFLKPLNYAKILWKDFDQIIHLRHPSVILFFVGFIGGWYLHCCDSRPHTVCVPNQD
jgi:hypothetical protein